MAVDRQAGPKPGAPSGAKEQGLQRTSNYWNEVVTELKKTTWPTNQEASRLTLVVIIVIIVLGIYMGVLDWALSALVSKFSLIK